MKKERINQEGTISSPVDCAKNSNTNQEIEIIEVKNNLTKEKLEAKILRDPSKYLNPILNGLTEEDLYDKTKSDCKKVPLIKRIELYPELPEDIFIPIFYLFSNGSKYSSKNYFINKKSTIINITTKNLINQRKTARYMVVSFSDNFNNNSSRNINIRVNRLMGFSFLYNVNYNLYSVVNHLNNKPLDNILSNLEWVTKEANSSVKLGKSNKKSKDKLVEYCAINDSGEIEFTVTSSDTKGYKIRTIIEAAYRHTRYNGYYWKSFNKNTKKSQLDLLGYTGNINDYVWYTHWRDNKLAVCKEGFVKYDGKILSGSIDSDGYVGYNIGCPGKKYRAGRLIMEFLEQRELSENEYVDHINTNKIDNSFENLRIVDVFENMRNVKTREKLTKKIVVCDLKGNVVFYGFTREASSFIKGYKVTGRIRADSILSVNVTKNKFICSEIDNKESILTKMESVIYMFKDNKLIYCSDKPNAFYKKYKIKYSTVHYFINSGRTTKDGYYFLKGKEAVELVVSLGYGNVLKFTPKNDFIEEKSKIDYSKYEKFKQTPEQAIFCSKNKPIRKYSLDGKFIKEYPTIESTGIRVHITDSLNGFSLCGNGFLWCRPGEENTLKEKQKYIYYKFDKNGKLVEYNIYFSKLTPVIKQREVEKYKKYLNTGMLAPDGFYYQQGTDFINPDPTNTDLIKKYPEIKWKITKTRKKKVTGKQNKK